MPSVTMKTAAGKSAGTVQLADDMFGIQPNVPVMHQAVTAQLAHRRAGTQSTKTRAEVAGGGKKPYKQKGTGNARQGSIRAPHYSGGGITHAPKPRNYTQKVNKKVVKLAVRSALSDRAAEGKVLVVDSWGLSTPKTKDAAAALKAIGVDGRALVVVRRDDIAAIKSFRNLPGVQIVETGELNAYDVLCNEWIVFSEASLPAAAAPDATQAAPAKKASAPKAAEPKVAEPVPADEPAVAEDVEPVADAEPAVEAEPVVEAEAVETASADAVQSFAAAPYAGAVLATDDGSGPEGYLIKGNGDSMLYHLPGGRWYDSTIAEMWFESEEAAVAAGFTKAGARKKAADADEEGDES